MSDCSIDPTLVAVTLALEAVELRLAEAGASVSQALADTARGRLHGAVGAVMPLAVSLSETCALIDSVLVLHRHGARDGDAPPGLFPD